MTDEEDAGQREAESAATGPQESGRSSLTAGAGRVAETASAVYRLASEAQITFLAAAIAYYAFVSMVPLVALGVALAAVLGGDALADRVVGLAGGLLAAEGEALLRSALQARGGLGGVTVIGLGVLLWGALKAFRALDHAFSLVYMTEPAASLLESVADAVVALSVVAAGGAAMVAVAGGVALFPEQVPGVVGAAVLLGALVVVFLPLYYLFPDVELRLGEVLAGAVFAAVGWTLLGATFGLYATYVSAASIYGLLGAVLLLLTWFYVGALLLLLGAALNAVRSGRAPASPT